VRERARGGGEKSDQQPAFIFRLALQFLLRFPARAPERGAEGQHKNPVGQAKWKFAPAESGRSPKTQSNRRLLHPPPLPSPPPAVRTNDNAAGGREKGTRRGCRLVEVEQSRRIRRNFSRRNTSARSLARSRESAHWLNSAGGKSLSWREISPDEHPRGPDTALYRLYPHETGSHSG
jgi:hypothetical protein